MVQKSKGLIYLKRQVNENISWADPLIRKTYRCANKGAFVLLSNLFLVAGLQQMKCHTGEL